MVSLGIYFCHKRGWFLLLLGIIFLFLCCKQEPSTKVHLVPCYVVKIGDTYRLLDKKGNGVPGLLFSAVGETFEGMMPVKKAGEDGWLFIDSTSGAGVPEKTSFRAVNMFSYGLAAVKTFDNKFGFIDKMGQWVISPEYEDAGFFDGETLPVKRTGKWGYIDAAGKERIPFQYDSASRFLGFWAEIEVGGKYSFINKEGHVLFSSSKRYDSVLLSSDIMALQRASEPWIVLSKDAVMIGQERGYYKISKFNDGLAAVMRFENGVGKWGFIDSKGKETIPLVYEQVTSFSKGIAAVKKDSLWGFISILGTYVIKPEYKEVSSSNSNGIWIVEKTNGEKGIFSSESGFLRLVFDEIGPFVGEGKTIKVMKNGLYGLVEINGKEILPVKYEDIVDDGGGLIRIKQNGNWGYGDVSGRIIINPMYKKACPFIEGQAFVIEKNGEGAFVDMTGNTIFKPKPEYSKIWRIDGKKICD